MNNFKKRINMRDEELNKVKCETYFERRERLQKNEEEDKLLMKNLKQFD